VASKYTRPALDALDLEILRAVRARSGCNMKEIYVPLVRPGRGQTKLIGRIKLLAAANYICLKHMRREFKVSVTDKGRRQLDNEKPLEKENMTGKVNSEAAKMRPSASLDEFCDPMEVVADGS